MNVDHENKKFNENVYKTLQIKLPLFHIFHRGHEFNFLMSSIYVHQGTLLISDSFIKFNYLNWTKKTIFFWISFDFIKFSIFT